jgi:DHA2 family methylenomycin A resistance protein-like MFS transporter
MSLFALCLGFFMVIIDVMIVNVALPNMAVNLSSNMTGLQWVVDGYTLTFASLLLSAGNIGDRLGAKNAFIAGLSLFVLTSFGCGVAHSVLILTIFRLLQGIAAAFIVPTSVALINASYDNKQDRTKAFGIWGTIAGVAGASGPILGAILTSYFSWRAVFFVNIPIGIIAIFLTLKYVVNPSAKKTDGFDLAGQSMAIISIAALAIALIEAGRLGWLSPLVLTAMVGFLICFSLFLIIEHRSSYPMLPLTFFKSNIFSTTMMAGMIVNIGFYGMLFLLPLYLQQVRHYTVLMSGLALIPLVFFSSISSYLCSRLVGLIGSKTPMIIGLFVGIVGFSSLLITGSTTPTYAWLILPFSAIGISATFAMTAATIAIMHSVPSDRAGVASGAFNASRQLGSLMGVAVFGTIISTASSFVTGMHINLIIVAVLYSFVTLAIFFKVKA